MVALLPQAPLATKGAPQVISPNPHYRAAVDGKGKAVLDSKGKGKDDRKGKPAEASEMADAPRHSTAAGAAVIVPGKGKESKTNSPAATGHATDTAGKGATTQTGKGSAAGAIVAAATAAGARVAAQGKGKDGKAAKEDKGLKRPAPDTQAADTEKGQTSKKAAGVTSVTAEAVEQAVKAIQGAVRSLPGQVTEDGQQKVQVQIGRKTLDLVIQAARCYVSNADGGASEPSKSLPEPKGDWRLGPKKEWKNDPKQDSKQQDSKQQDKLNSWAKDASTSGEQSWDADQSWDKDNSWDKKQAHHSGESSWDSDKSWDNKEDTSWDKKDTNQSSAGSWGVEKTWEKKAWGSDASPEKKDTNQNRAVQKTWGADAGSDKKGWDTNQSNAASWGDEKNWEKNAWGSEASPDKKDQEPNFTPATASTNHPGTNFGTIQPGSKSGTIQPGTKLAGQVGVASAASDVKTFFMGTLREQFVEDGYGRVDSAAARVKYNRDPFILLELLQVEGEDRPIAEQGDSLIFCLETDEENNLWTWEPIIPTARVFTGIVKFWNANAKVGQIHSDEIQELAAQDVIINATSFRNHPFSFQVEVNMQIEFTLTLNAARLQAANARRPGSNPAESPGKWRRLSETPGKGGKAAGKSIAPRQNNASGAEGSAGAMAKMESDLKALAHLQQALKRGQAEEIQRAKAKAPPHPSSSPFAPGNATTQQATQNSTVEARTPEIEQKLDRWVAARRSREYVVADKLRDELRAAGVEPEQARPTPINRRW